MIYQSDLFVVLWDLTCFHLGGQGKQLTRGGGFLTELLSYCRIFSCAIVGLMEAFHLRLADSFGTWNWSDAVAALCVLSHGVPWFRRQHEWPLVTEKASPTKVNGCSCRWLCVPSDGWKLRDRNQTTTYMDRILMNAGSIVSEDAVETSLLRWFSWWRSDNPVRFRKHRWQPVQWLFSARFPCGTSDMD